MGILATEILILLIVGSFYLFREKHIPLLERIINAAMIMQTVAMPIIFTSITRSVFEVSKLLTLRIILLIITTAWLTRLVVRQQQNHMLFNETVSLKDQKIFRIGPWQWLQTGVEWPLATWVVLNLISTFASPCWPIPLIGAYDRWEGIYLVLNYVVLFIYFSKFPQKRELLYWLFGGLTTSAFLSGVYGVFQSLGMDFMRWSVDPTARVFASINNPVHYSAYLAMLIPLCIGWILMIVSLKKEPFDLKQTYQAIKDMLTGLVSTRSLKIALSPELKRNLLIMVLFMFIIVMHYAANFLSFGRATWLGFTLSISLLYVLISGILNKTSPFKEFLDFAAYAAAIAMWNLVIIFKVQYLKPELFWPIWIAVTGVTVCNFFTAKDAKHFILKALVIIGCGNLQFVPTDLKATVLYLGCLWGYRRLLDPQLIAPQVKRFASATMLTLFLVLFIPSISVLWELETNNVANYIASVKQVHASIFQRSLIEKKDTFTIQKQFYEKYDEATKLKEKNKLSSTAMNIIGKSQGYTLALHGTGSARMSMWKTGLVWANTYPWFGTGPCTIKEMYPTFRRSDYGRLEGGQNYTPDKLHNDYINTMATNGFLGFAVYFLWFITAFLWVVLRRISANSATVSTPSNFVIIGLLCGVFVYWGQTFFNFGVVATKSLSYMLMGLTLAITINNPWRDFPDTLQDSTPDVQER